MLFYLPTPFILRRLEMKDWDSIDSTVLTD